VTYRKFLIEAPQILGDTVTNLVATAPWSSGFVQHYFRPLWMCSADYINITLNGTTCRTNDKKICETLKKFYSTKVRQILMKNRNTQSIVTNN